VHAYIFLCDQMFAIMLSIHFRYKHRSTQTNWHLIPRPVLICYRGKSLCRSHGEGRMVKTAGRMVKAASLIDIDIGLLMSIK